MSYFNGVKEGDKVWSLEFGWGYVADSFYLNRNSILVVFDKAGRVELYDYDGKIFVVDMQTLFWDEVKFEIPPRPKRMVKKVVEGWINVYPAVIDDGFYTASHRIYSSKEEADIGKKDGRVCDPVFIRHEYEVEE